MPRATARLARKATVVKESTNVAVVRGRLEPFAEELFRREGVKFERPTVNMLG